jgi:hypothetical protein
MRFFLPRVHARARLDPTAGGAFEKYKHLSGSNH